MKLNYLPILAILLIGVVFVSGCVSEESPTKATTPTQPSETPETTPPTTQSTTPTELNLNIGETAKTSKIEVTVFSAQKTKSYDYYSDIFKETMTEEAKPGKIFILVDAEIKNVGSNSVFVGSSEFSITDSEGYKYDPALYYGDDGLEMFKELYQNQKMRGKILFEVPENAQDLKLQYNFGNLFIGTKLASWSIE
ncbi:MAG TPA: DUF4352 domain-containing protein [Calditrichaeota bacterium]|nr:DUF4352 domain-containing protein [Calditrichota bacterium]